MSASLVGSEMCIRDRWGPPAPRWTGRARTQSGPTPWARTPRRTPRLGTVSYTHLTLPTICSV
eukprot:10796511-Alexandrium_andersonii.AAC.1